MAMFGAKSAVSAEELRVLSSEAVRDAQMCDGYLLQNLLLNAYNATALASFTLEGITVL